jgi:hypothetical protein
MRGRLHEKLRHAQRCPGRVGARFRARVHGRVRAGRRLAHAARQSLRGWAAALAAGFALAGVFAPRSLAPLNRLWFRFGLLRLDPGAASYWIERDPPGPAPGSFERQF